MEEISLPKIKTVKEDQSYGQFVIEPFFPGYGQTIGNALRRVLISSLEGAAISAIKIDGVTHQFSTIPGVKEDVIEIILNLKKIRMKLFDEEKATMTLNFKGAGKVLAKDIKTPSQIEIINKDLHLATLDNAKSNLNIEMTVENGRGYEIVESRTEKPQIGIIQVDSLYSPVVWVNFKIDNTRVGQRTDYNRLTIEIETDGTQTPSSVLKKSVEILVKQFAILTDIESKIKDERKTIKKIVKKEKTTKVKSAKKETDEKKVVAKKRTKKASA